MAGGISTTGRATNKLSDRGVRAFISSRSAGGTGTKKLSDGGGLYLTLTPSGTPVWRIKYRLGGSERLYSAGVFPEVSLEAARGQREVVKAQLREGNDPLKARQVKPLGARRCRLRAAGAYLEATRIQHRTVCPMDCDGPHESASVFERRCESSSNGA